MGIEIIRLNEEVDNLFAGEGDGLSKLSFSLHQVQDQSLSIWLMNSTPGAPPYPWWTYNSQLEEEIKRLDESWSVTSAQSFFDCLFMSQFKKALGSNFYAIAPGYLRTEGWDKMPEISRAAYLRGQGCVYRLEGSFEKKLSINWVPFAQPQSVIKDPSFSTLWPMFVASRNDDVANSMGFFSLTDIRRLPEVVSQLIQTNENRSMDLAALVQWFGLYSSPLNPDHGSCAVVYTKNNQVIARLTEFQTKFQAMLDETRETLGKDPTPHTAFRILSRFVAV